MLSAKEKYKYRLNKAKQEYDRLYPKRDDLSPIGWHDLGYARAEIHIYTELLEEMEDNEKETSDIIYYTR